MEITTTTEIDRIMVALTDNSTGNTVDFPISLTRVLERYSLRRLHRSLAQSVRDAIDLILSLLVLIR